MVIRSNRRAYLTHHLCEALLLCALAAPIVVLRFTGQTLAIVGFFLFSYLALGYYTDMASQLRVDDDGLTFLEGGQQRGFLAWSEIGRVVPRTFSGWPAENALVVLNRDGRPLMVAGTSMFSDGDVDLVTRLIRRYVPVANAVALSPFTGRADGRQRPELAPSRTSERLLASAVGGLATVALIAGAIFVMTQW